MPRILTPGDIAEFRSRLCDVAARLFAELGHEGFNMRELAKRLGVSAMTPYRYFEDKNAILTEVRSRAFARLADWLEDALAGEDADMTTLIHAYAQFAVQEQIQYRLMFDLAQPQSQGAAAVQEQRLRTILVGYAGTLGGRGLLGGDPEELGLMLWTGLHGVAGLYLAGKISSGDFHKVLSAGIRLIQDDARAAPAGFPLHAAPSWLSAPAAFQPLAGE